MRAPLIAAAAARTAGLPAASCAAPSSFSTLRGHRSNRAARGAGDHRLAIDRPSAEGATEAPSFRFREKGDQAAMQRPAPGLRAGGSGRTPSILWLTPTARWLFVPERHTIQLKSRRRSCSPRGCGCEEDVRRFMSALTSDIVDGAVRHARQLSATVDYDWPIARSVLERVLADLEARNPAEPSSGASAAVHRRGGSRVEDAAIRSIVIRVVSPAEAGPTLPRPCFWSRLDSMRQAPKYFGRFCRTSPNSPRFRGLAGRGRQRRFAGETPPGPRRGPDGGATTRRGDQGGAARCR